MKNERYPRIYRLTTAMPLCSLHGTRKRGRQKKRWIDMIREDCRELHLTLQESEENMQDAGQESVESNHRRVADACNGIARAVKEKEEETVLIMPCSESSVVCYFHFVILPFNNGHISHPQSLVSSPAGFGKEPQKPNRFC